MFLMMGSNWCARMDFNSFQSLNIKTLKSQKFKIYDLQNRDCEVLQTEEWDKMFFGQVIQTNINAPDWILLDESNKIINSHHRYNIFYRIAGASSKTMQLTNTADCLIYDAEQYNSSSEYVTAYYYKLPSLSQRLTSVASTLSTANKTIYSIGRNQIGKNLIHSLCLNANELEWKEHENILKERIFGVALTVIEQRKDATVLLMCGGRNMNRNVVNNVNVINMTNQSNVSVKAMNYKRAYFDCVWLKDHQFIAGGGYKDCRTLEIYDIVKNVWMEVPQQTNYAHEGNACLGVDNCNENIVYIGGKQLGYDPLDTLGCVEWCDLRQNTKKFQVLGSLEHLFGINQKAVNDKWVSRSLFI